MSVLAAFQAIKSSKWLLYGAAFALVAFAIWRGFAELRTVLLTQTQTAVVAAERAGKSELSTKLTKQELANTEKQIKFNKTQLEQTTAELQIARQRENRLRATFDGHDLDSLLARRPTQVITKINLGTQRAFDRISLVLANKGTTHEAAADSPAVDVDGVQQP